MIHWKITEKRINGEILTISQFKSKKIITECIVDNDIDSPLRKVIHLSVSGKDLRFSFITKLKQTATLNMILEQNVALLWLKLIVISDIFLTYQKRLFFNSKMNLTFALILCQLFPLTILTQIFKYHLWDAPKLLALSQQNTVSKGVLFRLYCSILSGTKPLFFQWSKNGQILSNSPQTKYKI